LDFILVWREFGDQKQRNQGRPKGGPQYRNSEAGYLVDGGEHRSVREIKIEPLRWREFRRAVKERGTLPRLESSLL